MKISTRARYAIRMMLDIHEHGQEGAPTRLSEVAERTGISRRYLDQVVMPLKSASLILGIKGRRGGYRLARPAADIRLDEIVEAAIGPVGLVDCVLSPETCKRSEKCACRVLYRLLSLGVRAAMHEYTLADLADADRLRHMEDQVAALEAALQE